MPPKGKQQKIKKSKVVPENIWKSADLDLDTLMAKRQVLPKFNRMAYSPPQTNVPSNSPASPSSPEFFTRPRANAVTPVSPFTRGTTVAISKEYKAVNPKEKKISPEFKKQQLLQTVFEKPIPVAKTPMQMRGLYGSHRMDRPSIDIPPLLLPPTSAGTSVAPPQSTLVKKEKSKKKVLFNDTDDIKLDIPEFKKGGRVKKTGVAKVHKGEVVVPANRVASVDKALKKAGKKPLKK